MIRSILRKMAKQTKYSGKVYIVKSGVNYDYGADIVFVSKSYDLAVRMCRHLAKRKIKYYGYSKKLNKEIRIVEDKYKRINSHEWHQEQYDKYLIIEELKLY